MYGSLSSRGAYLTAAPAPAAGADDDTSAAEGAAAGRGTAAEVQFWKSIGSIRDPSAQTAALLAYRAQYPNGVYIALADIQLKSLQASGRAPPQAPSSSTPTEDALDLTRDDRRRVQRALAAGGFDPGPADGLFGRGTRSAIREWQAATGLPVTGHLDADAVKDLLAAEAESHATGGDRVPEATSSAAADPSRTFLTSGISLSDWVLLAEDRLAAGEYRSLLVESADHARKYGTFDGVSSVMERAIAGLVQELRVTDEASARSTLESVKQIEDVSGPRAPLHRIEAKAYSRLGRFREAVEAYRSWLRLAPSDHPERKSMIIGLQRALRGERLPVALGTFRDCEECPELVVMPIGAFRMGSPPWEGERDDSEGPLRGVTVRHRVAMGVREVTFAEWDACRRDGGCSHDPSDQGWGRANRPVINVSWEDAQEYVGWLSSKTGERYRLPSESEWEYAARAGTTTRFHWGDRLKRNAANCAGCGSRWDGARTAPAGSFLPNAFGLHDMHGNVWEWVEDCWHPNYGGAPLDARVWIAWGDCGRRVVRGGSYFTTPALVRSAFRGHEPPRKRLRRVGFRVARALD